MKGSLDVNTCVNWCVWWLFLTLWRDHVVKKKGIQKTVYFFIIITMCVTNVSLLEWILTKHCVSLTAHNKTINQMTKNKCKCKMKSPFSWSFSQIERLRRINVSIQTKEKTIVEGTLNPRRNQFIQFWYIIPFFPLECYPRYSLLTFQTTLCHLFECANLLIRICVDAAIMKWLEYQFFYMTEEQTYSL